MNEHALLPIKIAAWATIAAACISMFATPALSAELPAPAVAAPFVACLQADAAHCQLIAHTVAISIAAVDGDAMISYYVPDVTGLKVDHTESINKDVEELVIDGEMSPDEGAAVFAELFASQDLGYKLPAGEGELKKSVGFPDAAPLSPQDQVDILASHLQMNLGVSALTADYLVTKLGLEIVQ